MWSFALSVSELGGVGVGGDCPNFKMAAILKPHFLNRSLLYVATRFHLYT